MKNGILKALGTAALAVAVNVGTMGSANAAVVHANWDPLFGAAFPSLRWNGTADFYVPTLCLAQAAGMYTNSGLCAGIAVQSAQVKFFDSSDVLQTTSLETLNFGSLPLLTYLQLGAPGVVTNLMSTGTTSLTYGTIAQAGGGFDWFQLGFIADQAYLQWGTDGGGLAGASDYVNYPATMTFTVLPDSGRQPGSNVPEPGSMVLLLTALAGVVTTRRRRQ
jgi:hypothetical protein